MDSGSVKKTGERMEMNIWIEDWLNARAESDATKIKYEDDIAVFANFCRERSGRDFTGVVRNWRKANKNWKTRQVFLEEWEDVVRNFYTFLNSCGKYAPLTVKNLLIAVRSFFGFWKIPVDVELPKRACVIYHNKDLTKDDLRQILTYATARDRAMWLVMAESGMRSITVIDLRYWQIKEDFEKERVPMKVDLPADELKYKVDNRFTFIGEEGFNALKEYLKPKLPLMDEDFVFASEKEGRMVGERFSVSSLSVKFSRIVQKLKLCDNREGKPKAITQRSLRKYFRNHISPPADTAYRKFWMGHSLGVDAHYITRDEETHRKEYAKGYGNLRLHTPPELMAKHYVTETTLRERIQVLQQQLEALKPLADFISGMTPEEVEAFKMWLKKPSGAMIAVKIPDDEKE